MNRNIRSRSIEGTVLKEAMKYVSKAIFRNVPRLKIIFALFMVRVGLKQTIAFSVEHIGTASKWVGRLRIGKTKRYSYCFPGGLKMHRAVGIPEFDNSGATTLMCFEKIFPVKTCRLI